MANGDWNDLFVNTPVDEQEGQFELGGLLPREEEYGNLEGVPLFGNSGIETIPRSEWVVQPDDETIKAMVRKIKDQGREGSCTSNATCQLFEILWNRTFGLDKWIEFSPISLYKRCGSSPNSGSSCSKNIREIRTRGILPVDNATNREFLQSVGLNSNHVMPSTGFYTRYPSGWEETAIHFRVDEIFDIENMDEFFSALQKGCPILYGRSGHAICSVKLAAQSGQHASEYANSWKPSWGMNGYGRDTESYLRNAIRNYGAFAGRSVHVPEFMLAA